MPCASAPAKPTATRCDGDEFVPRTQRSAQHLRSGALQSRGRNGMRCLVRSRLCAAALRTLQRVRETEEASWGVIMGALPFRAVVKAAPIFSAAAFVATPAFADNPAINAADTAWMIVATALVL